MTKITLSQGVVGIAALVALTLGTAAHAQKARDASTAAQGPRGLITGKVSPQIIQRADGSQEIESDESMLNTSVLVKMPDGSLRQFCVANPEIARRLVSGQRVSFAKNMLERANDR
jgi:hypothetical protein